MALLLAPPNIGLNDWAAVDVHNHLINPLEAKCRYGALGLDTGSWQRAKSLTLQPCHFISFEKIDQSPAPFSVEDHFVNGGEISGWTLWARA